MFSSLGEKIMANSGDRDLVKVATMYYKEDMKQSEIAKHLGISRSLVSKYLIDARNQGIVDIYIRSESAYSIELEIELEKKFGLHKAVVLDTNNLRENEIERLIVQTAIQALRKDIAKAHTIGLSWGKMLRRFIDEYPYQNDPETTIIPLIGGMGSEYVDIHSNQLAYDFARKLRAKCKYLYVPALVDNQAIKSYLLENEAIKAVLGAGRKVDLALVGLASPFSKNNTMLQIGYINTEDVAQLKTAQVVGDINSRFFDEQGNESECQINQYVMGINLADLKKIEKVAAICFEEDKQNVLYTALKADLLNIITVTDTLAEYLLSRLKEEDGD